MDKYCDYYAIREENIVFSVNHKNESDWDLIIKIITFTKNTPLAQKKALV
jgi:hypothetical protein